MRRYFRLAHILTMFANYVEYSNRRQRIADTLPLGETPAHAPGPGLNALAWITSGTTTQTGLIGVALRNCRIRSMQLCVLPPAAGERISVVATIVELG